jgi:hypothetical protein
MGQVIQSVEADRDQDQRANLSLYHSPEPEIDVEA